jgi:DNA-binding GntR family transcriptional regulator
MLSDTLPYRVGTPDSRQPARRPRQNERSGMEDGMAAVAPRRPAARGDGAGSTVEWVIARLREMILRGDIAPGQHLRQEELAGLLDVSRAPVREALKSLATEGLLSHNLHQGYFLARLGAHEMRQVYLMRRLLETALLEAARWPDEEELAELADLNARVRAANEANSRDEVITANRAFHFRIFGLADADLVLAEVRRLWDLSEVYRALYLFSADSRSRVPDEHDELVDALRRQDRAACVEIMERHRGEAEERVTRMLRDRA